MRTANAPYSCPVEATLHLMGGKYKPLILWHLKEQTLRFSQLQKLVPKATAKMLTQQLRELEQDKLISRRVYPVVPPKTEYSLTDRGRTLIPVLDAMCSWGRTYMEEQEETFFQQSPCCQTASGSVQASPCSSASSSHSLLTASLKAHGSYVYNLALRLTCHPQDAEDLAQETWLKAWEHITELKEPGSVRYWLRTICINCFRMKCRKEGRLKLEFSDDLEALERDGTLLTEVLPSPAAELEASEEVKKLRDGCFLAMARKLTLEQRIVFSLVDMFGLSAAEAALSLEITPQAAKGLLYRARMNLDSFLKGHCSFLDIENPCRCQAWIRFMEDRNHIQKQLKQQFAPLEFREKGYIFDPDTRSRLLHFYRSMPDKRPPQEWFDNVITLFSNGGQ